MYIFQCYEKHNKPINGVPRDYPLCSAELKDRMTAAKDSETCWRRSNLVVNLSPGKVNSLLCPHHVGHIVLPRVHSYACLGQSVHDTCYEVWYL